MENDKCVFAGITAEITRLCNMQCPHCSNGEPQDLSMTPEIIDRVFEEVADCKAVWFGGGEVLLRPDLIEAFVNRIIDSDWTTWYVEFTTNGKILSMRIVDLLEKFCRSKTGRKALIRISRDDFHEKGYADTAMAFYQKNVANPNISLEFVEAGADVSPLYPVGRCKKLLKSHPELYQKYTIFDYTVNVNEFLSHTPANF